MVLGRFQKKRRRRVSRDIAKPLKRSSGALAPAVEPTERLLAVAAFAVGAVFILAEGGQRAGSQLGLAVLVVGVVFLAGRYFLKFQRDAVRDLRSVASLLGIALIVLLVARFTRNSDTLHPLLVPLPLVSIVFAILVSPRFAIEAAAVLVGLLGFLFWGMDDFVRLILTLFAGACTGALYSMRVRRPSRLLAVGLLVGMTQLLVLAAVSLFREELPARATLLRELSLGLGVGLVTGFAVMGLLPLFERMMNRLSDITLLEYSNQSEQPLLRRLQIEAAGTQSHSFHVAQLAEAAAEAIGANGLLCKVGCYFHDIGKMSKPEYFSENSIDAKGRHAELAPEMSKLIIIGHVKDGVELAELHHLPEPIIAFIREHHGTTAVEYFYRLAVQLRPDEEIPREDYRYPGPRPQSRETAIAMVADSVEAASRSMKAEWSPSNLEKLIDEIVAMKMRDKQLDECGLTMRELTLCREAMLPVLSGFKQNRPSFPGERRRKPQEITEDADLEFMPELAKGRFSDGARRAVPGEAGPTES